MDLDLNGLGPGLGHVLGHGLGLRLGLVLGLGLGLGLGRHLPPLQLVNFSTGQLLDWSTSQLVNLSTGQLEWPLIPNKVELYVFLRFINIHQRSRRVTIV
jgi:hypothetical protein